MGSNEKCSIKVQHLDLKPRQTSPEVQNRFISGPTKRTDVLQKCLQKVKQLMRHSSSGFSFLIAKLYQFQTGGNGNF